MTKLHNPSSPGRILELYLNESEVFFNLEELVVKMREHNTDNTLECTDKTILKIISGEERVTAQIAKLLGIAFDTSAEFWTNLQTQYDDYLTRVRTSIDDSEKEPKPMVDMNYAGRGMSNPYHATIEGADELFPTKVENAGAENRGRGISDAIVHFDDSPFGDGKVRGDFKNINIGDDGVITGHVKLPETLLISDTSEIKDFNKLDTVGVQVSGFASKIIDTLNLGMYATNVSYAAAREAQYGNSIAEAQISEPYKGVSVSNILAFNNIEDAYAKTNRYIIRSFDNEFDPILMEFHKGPLSDKGMLKGPINENLIDILIDRLKELNDNVPCEENSVALEHIIKAREALSARDARIARDFNLASETEVRDK